jgi:hypothetical protein
MDLCKSVGQVFCLNEDECGSQEYILCTPTPKFVFLDDVSKTCLNSEVVDSVCPLDFDDYEDFFEIEATPSAIFDVESLDDSKGTKLMKYSLLPLIAAFIF